MFLFFFLPFLHFSRQISIKFGLHILHLLLKHQLLLLLSSLLLLPLLGQHLSLLSVLGLLIGRKLSHSLLVLLHSLLILLVRSSHILLVFLSLLPHPLFMFPLPFPGCFF